MDEQNILRLHRASEAKQLASRRTNEAKELLEVALAALNRGASTQIAVERIEVAMKKLTESTDALAKLELR